MIVQDWTKRNDVAQISNEAMDEKEREYPNLIAEGFSGIPFYASPDGRTLPREKAKQFEDEIAEL